MRKLLMTFAIALAAMSASAQGNQLIYADMPDGTKWVTYWTDKNHQRLHYSGNIVIPDVVDGKPVTGIMASTFQDNTDVTSVIIGNNVKTISGNAFYGCNHLAEITIPASVDSIGEWCFRHAGLKKATFANGDNTLKIWDWGGYTIFADCPIETAHLGRNYESGRAPFRGLPELRQATVSDNVWELQTGEFQDCNKLLTVSLGKNITAIGDDAFHNCDTLQTITMPASVTSIGANAFRNCKWLKSATLSENTKIIKGFAFYNCYSLAEITIPASVDSIGEWCFRYAGLKKATFANGDNPLKIWDWGGYTIFADCPIETAHLGRNYESGRAPFRGLPELRQATVSDNVWELQTGEFQDCNKLLTVSLGKNITAIGDDAFHNCDTLQTITMPASVTSIGANAFTNCKWLKSATLSENTKIIKGNAFYNCYSLAEITIPASVDSIGEWCFRYAGLKKATFANSDNPLKIWDWGGYTIFADCPIETAHLGRNYESGRAPFRGLPELRQATVSDNVWELQTGEFQDCNKLLTVSLGKNITAIGDDAFHNCDTLQTITMPASVTSIGTNAFTNCKWLKSATLSENTKIIKGNAFYNCNNLAEITIPASVDSIGEWCFRYAGLKKATFANSDNPLKIWDWGGYTIFADCPIETAHLGRNYESGRAPFRGLPELRQATVSDNVWELQKGEFQDCNKLLTVSLGKNITAIGDNAFYNCDTLQTISMPASVNTIGQNAFAYCTWLKSATLSENTKIIKGNAFYNCKHLAEITIPASVDSIGEWCFRYAGLKKATFADGANPLKIWDWGGYTIFADCPIETAHLGRNYESGRDIFRDIRTIKRASIGSMVSELHANEFRACDSIANIYSYSQVPPTCLSYNVFANTNKQTCQLHIPQGTAEAYKSAFVWQDFFNIVEMPAGDVNGDGLVDVADIATILSVMAGNVGNTNPSAADVNCDQKVDVADISTVLSIMAGR